VSNAQDADRQVVADDKQLSAVQPAGRACDERASEPHHRGLSVGRVRWSFRALRLVGDDDPHHQVDHQTRATEHGQHDEQHPHQRRVKVEVSGPRLLVHAL
jgi:hypothetical protein